MEKRVIRQLEVNKLAVEAYFSTSLAISLVRETVVKCAKCVLLPVQGPDCEFSDPVLGRVLPILWETRIFINFGNTPITATVYVVADHEAGFPLILGMDTLLALGMNLSMNDISPMNPLYPIPGECRPILSTGLITSMASEKWFHDDPDAVAINYNGPPTIYDPVTKTTIKIIGKASYPLPRNPTFCILIAEIPAYLVYGLDALTPKLKLKFPGATISWPQPAVMRGDRPRPHKRGPTCPTCGEGGHLKSQCAEHAQNEAANPKPIGIAHRIQHPNNDYTYFPST
ncbi:hypothetical protein DAPPUDRAFT_107337 [Daphnia pulex]|uniref:CCHC-type domain-containing protein n=1 Tax=Daphnia pulex TaxID=6669 RepID=E9GWT1_DAPPU|nr:hypothetical protein DAPPUDRAFT_107337 [Daphnia pulex]|eukprot:EFX76064.1 hypothetical protein DAPPUDRAFT_107337 [Daphnia pulex]